MHRQSLKSKLVNSEMDECAKMSLIYQIGRTVSALFYDGDCSTLVTMSLFGRRRSVEDALPIM